MGLVASPYDPFIIDWLMQVLTLSLQDKKHSSHYLDTLHPHKLPLKDILINQSFTSMKI